MAASSAARVAGTEMAAAVTPDSERAPAMADVPVVAVGEAEAAEALGAAEAAADDCETVGDALAEMVGVGVADTADDALDAFDAARVSVGEGVGVGEGLDAFDTAGKGEGVGVDVSVGDGVALKAFDATGEGDGVGVGVGEGEGEGVRVAKGAAASTPAEFTPPQLPAQGTHVGSEVLTMLIERAPIL
jgi:hypothetical protein